MLSKLVIIMIIIDVIKSSDVNVDYIEQFNEANRMLTDLDELINLLLQRQNEKSSILMGKNAEHVRYKDNTPITSGVFKKTATPENVNQLIINLNDLDKKLQVTFHDLQQRRRYVLGAMIRQMQYTVRRIRTNVSRLNQQMIAVDNVATQMPLMPLPVIHSANSSSSMATPESTMQQMNVNKEIIQEIEHRLHLTMKKMNDIVLRLNSSLSSTNSVISNDVKLNMIDDHNKSTQSKHHHHHARFNPMTVSTAHPVLDNVN